MKNLILFSALFLFSTMALAQTKPKSCCDSKKEKTCASKKEEKPKFQATIDGQNIISLKKSELNNLEIKASKEINADITDEKGNFVLDNFSVFADVVEFKLKIPGQPTKMIKGNQVNLADYAKLIKSNDSIYIFDIAYKDGKAKNAEIIYSSLNPIVIDIL